MTAALAQLLSRVNIGEPSSAGGLRVFPLFPLDRGAVRYRLLSDALGDGSSQVDELLEEEVARENVAWFQRLAVRNRGDAPVLVRDSDVLTGGRQDRKADQPCLIGPASRAIVPVLCVEQGRSHYSGEASFSSSPSSADPELRRIRLREGADDRQGRSWEHVANRRTSSGLPNAAGSFAELETVQGPALDRVLSKLPPVLHACGLVIAAHGRVEAVEIHADVSAVSQAWPALVRSVAQTLPVEAVAPRISRTEIRRYFAAAALADYQALPAFGIAAQQRVTFKGGVGTVLSVGRDLAHVALLAA
jgi:hypothetical protein